MDQEILRYHAEKYPLLQPEDAVKLLYQQTFGVGHLITDRRSFAEQLYREMEECVPVPGLPLTEPVGCGLIRVMLNSPGIDALRTEDLIASCLHTAESCHGSMDEFLAKLSELQDVCRTGLFGFSPAELDRYLDAYRKDGCPPVSHSRIYRDAYHPSYRVTEEHFLSRLSSGS